ncbi:MAG: 50S ribosomal protein L25/general stress protein Ctc, partial [Thermocrispum sp.]
AVLYGHGTDPKHLALPAIEFARVIRENGRNAVLTLQVSGSKAQLALTKTIVVHPLKNYIEHVDLLVLKRGERVTVDVPIVLVGDPVPGTLVHHEMDALSIEVDALQIPEQFDVDLEDAAIGTSYNAGDITLPDGATLLTDPEWLVVAVNEAPTAEEMEEPTEAEEAAEEGDEVAEAAEGGEGGEGESPSAESTE